MSTTRSSSEIEQPAASNKRVKSTIDLIGIAKDAFEAHPNSDVEVAIEFVKNVGSHEFLKLSHSCNDRLVKVGRSIVNLMTTIKEMKEQQQQDGGGTNVEDYLQSSLELLVQECELISVSNNNNDINVRVPTVRFGKTEIQMPIVTLGAMRFQQKW